MKREGTGEPRAPDISFDADVKMRELHFERVPDPKVRFRGSTDRNSVWGSRRENLPDEVREGVVYREAGVRLRIASEIIGGDPELLHSSNEKREKTSLERSRQKTAEQETQTQEEAQ